MTDSTPTSGTPTDPTAPESAGTTVTATVRGIELGRARPEIIVPLVGDDHDAVLAQADAALKTPARIIEWRIDRFRPDLEDSEDLRPHLAAYLGPYAAHYGTTVAHLREAAAIAMRLGWVCRAINGALPQDPGQTHTRLKMFLDRKP